MLNAFVSRVKRRIAIRMVKFCRSTKEVLICVRIGIALSNFGYNPRDAWWGVPRIGSIELPVVAKHLRELREVYVRPEALRHGNGVMIQPSVVSCTRFAMR